MGLFKALFNLAVLPVVVAKDVVCALPDASMGRGIFKNTERQCEKIDESWGWK